MLRRIPTTAVRLFSTSASCSSSTAPERPARGAAKPRVEYKSSELEQQLREEEAAAKLRRLLGVSGSNNKDKQPTNTPGGGGSKYPWPPSHFANPNAGRTKSTSGFDAISALGRATSTTSPRDRRGGAFASDTPATPDDLWRDHQMPVSYPPPLETWSSRSIAVTDNGKVEQAWRQLNGILTENKLRQKLRADAYFESKSDQRVRLASERHRRRFKLAVGRKVAEALRLRKKKTVVW